MLDERRATDSESRLATYLAQYDPAVVKLANALRARLRARLPGLNEIVYVYERQNSVVLSYSPTEGGIDGVCAIAVEPREIKLHFGQGASLSKADPKRLLQGRGKTVRHVVLNAVADFDRAEIEALIAAAVKLAKLRLVPGARSSILFKTEAQKQRARRAARAVQPAATRRKTDARR